MTVVLSGYRIGLAIYTETRTLVYRGVRESDNQPVVLNFLANPYPTFSELLQFRNQYTIAKNLNIPGIIRPESLERYGNSYALVMPDVGGISLREYSQIYSLEIYSRSQHFKLSVPSSLAIVRSLPLATLFMECCSV